MLSTLLKDTWEELDPDELSYEVNCVWIQVPLVELCFFLAFFNPYPKVMIIISGVACIGRCSWNREQRAFS